MRLIGGLAAMALAALLPARAGAQCPTFTPVTADGRVTPFTVAPGADRGFYFNGPPGHSYSVEVYGPTLGALSARFGDADDLCPSVSMPGANPTNGIDPLHRGGFRASFTTTASGTPTYLTRVVTVGGGDLFVSVSDTTLYSTAWTTNGTYNTFYSLLNTTNATCTGVLTLFNTAGTEVTSTPLSIPSGATGSTNTQSLGTARNTSGTARFTHDCPPGAFLAEAAIANFSITPTPYFQFVHFQPTRESGR